MSTADTGAPVALKQISGRHERFSASLSVLQWNTVPEDLGWLPDDGVVLTRADLERLFIDLRALIAGTAELDANRAHAVDIAVTLAQALERNRGEDR